MYVRELMTRDPITVRSSASVQEVLDLMADRDVRHLPIVDGGELVGMVSDRDLRQISWTAVVEGGRQPLTTPVVHFMTGDPYSVGENDDVTDAIDLLIEHKVGAVPVVDEADGSVIGIVSYMDVLKYARDAL